MCAQCAFIALAAIGTYSAFHSQIRARVDRTLGIDDDAGISSIVPGDAESSKNASAPLTPERSITFAVFLLALSQIRHRTDLHAASPKRDRHPDVRKDLTAPETISGQSTRSFVPRDDGVVVG